MDIIDTPEIITGTDALFLKLAPGVAWRLRSHGRLHGGLLTGGSGSGKTTLARRIALGAAEAGLRVSLYDLFDQDRFTINRVGRCSAPSQIRESLERTSEVEVPLRREGRWHRSVRDDDRLIVIDHFEHFLNDEPFLQWIEQIARCGPKLGVALVLAGQFELRDLPAACREGNLAALSVTSWRMQRDLDRFGFRSKNHRVPAFHVDPVTGETTGFDPRA